MLLSGGKGDLNTLHISMTLIFQLINVQVQVETVESS